MRSVSLALKYWSWCNIFALLDRHDLLDGRGSALALVKWSLRNIAALLFRHDLSDGRSGTLALMHCIWCNINAFLVRHDLSDGCRGMLTLMNRNLRSIAALLGLATFPRPGILHNYFEWSRWYVGPASDSST
jgi:hypothetical protein